MEPQRVINHEEQANGKKAYSTPELNKVQLVASEAVLALCKFGVTGGSGQEVCTLDLSCVSTAHS